MSLTSEHLMSHLQNGGAQGGWTSLSFLNVATSFTFPSFSFPSFSTSIFFQNQANYWDFGLEDLSVAPLNASVQPILTLTPPPNPKPDLVLFATIFGTSDDDTLNGTADDDNIYGIDGNDTLNGLAGDDFLNGSNDNDILNGGDGEDILNGGNHNDELNGGAGNDELNGGRGNDDLDGGAGDDVINGGDGFDNITASAGADTIDGGADRDTLSYLASTSGVEVYLDGVTAGTGGLAQGDILSNLEEITGSDHNDIFHTGSTNLIVEGLAGNDIFHLGINHGQNEIYGGSGDDTVVFDAAVFDNAIISGSFYAETFQLAGAVDANFIFNSVIVGAIYIFDIIEFETSSGADLTLTWDYFFSGSSYTVIGDNTAGSTEALILNDVSSVDLSTWTFTDWGGQGETITITGTGANNTITGSIFGDIVNGGNGNDTLNGGAGNDQLDGGDGIDTLDGGAGDDIINGEYGSDQITASAGADTIDGGAGRDTLSYSASTSGVEVYFDGVTAGTGGLAQGDILSNLEEITGSNHNDIFHTESTGLIIEGLAGNDIFHLGTNHGQNEIYGGSGDDTIIFDATVFDDAIISGSFYVETFQFTGAADANFIFNSVIVGAIYIFDIIEFDASSGADLTLTWDFFSSGSSYTVIGDNTAGSTEALILNDVSSVDLSTWTFTNWGGQGETITVNGTGSSNTLTGSVVDDILKGYAGEDILDGGDGNDRLFGHDGDDILMGGANNDFLFGGTGNDELHGGDQTDRLFGGDGNDYLYGDGNNDIMYGGGNVDRLYGGNGNDNINGGSNVDFLYGEANNDIIYGGNAADRIDGGSGNDTLYGGNRGGNDTSGDFFIFANNFGTDTIMDFQDGLDLIDFSGHTGINSFADVLARASEDGTSLLIATNANNTLIIENFSLAELDASDFVF